MSKEHQFGFIKPTPGGDGISDLIAEIQANPESRIDLFEQQTGDELCAYIENMSKILGNVALQDDFDLAA